MLAASCDCGEARELEGTSWTGEYLRTSADHRKKQGEIIHANVIRQAFHPLPYHSSLPRTCMRGDIGQQGVRRALSWYIDS